MSGPDNQFEDMARQAARSIEASRELAEQLTLLPDVPVAAAEGDTPARRGPGKAVTQMRDWLAARGYRLPEDVLAEMAGLASREDAILTAMVQAERILAWAGEGALNRKFMPGVGHVDIPGPWRPTPEQKLQAFQSIYATMLRAADALMPYGAPKMTPEQVTNQQVTQIVVAGGAMTTTRTSDQARDVTPGRRRIAPPPMPGEVDEKQRLGNEPSRRSDDGIRTE